MQRRTALSLSVWLVINVILASASHYLMTAAQLVGLGDYGLYVFFAFVLLLIALNIVFLVKANGILLRGLFAMAILWLGFFSIMIGSVDTIGILFNLGNLLSAFADLV